MKIDHGKFLQYHIGRHKLKKNLYHITTKEAYQNIKKEGYLYPSIANGTESGLFLVDFPNFLKRWCGISKNYPQGYLFKNLLSHIAGRECEDVVLLRIPTEVLEKNALKVRSVERHAQNIVKIRERQKNIKELPKETIKALFGDFAKYSPKYKQKREAVEYIYPYEIKLSNIQEMGTFRFTKSLRKTSIGEIITQLVKGHPEENGVTNIQKFLNK